MKTAAVVIDKWKLPIFKRHLEDAGYKFDESVGLTEGTLPMLVKYELVYNLKPVIEAANTECANG